VTKEATIPLDSLPTSRRTDVKEEAAVVLPNESEGSEGGFEDIGREIAQETSPSSEQPDTEFKSYKLSPESSFGGLSDKTTVGGTFTKVTLVNKQITKTRTLFGEISNPVIPPPKTRMDVQTPRGNIEIPRSPSPVRPGSRRDLLRRENARSSSAPGGPGRSITIKPNERLVTTELPKVEEPAFKPGIPGQIERLYCDINSMIGTLGINSRALSSFLLYQGTSKEPNFGRWAEILRGDHPQGILDEKIVLADMDKLNECVEMLSRDLQQQRLQKVHKKLEQCQQLLSRDIFNLRGQCASLQKIIDMHADTAAVLSAPLSAEQANLQQELRKSSATVQSKLADLEQGITFLRAKIADKVTSDGAANGTSSAKQSMKKPTVAAVTDTIDRMTKMAESKSSDIDVLEAQMRKLGLDVSGARGSREGTPFTTPLKQSTGRLPITPGSFGSPSGHTPESGKLLHSSVHRTTKPNLSRSIRGGVDMLTREDCERWKEKARRRKEVLRNLKEVLAERKVVVREWADS
jgi:nucleoporin NUP159